MRMSIVTIPLCLFLSACAGGGLSNSAGLEPTQFERLGTVTSVDVAELQGCNDKQVNWCSNKRGKKNCKCVYTYEVRDRTRRIAEQLRFPNN